MNRDQVAAMRIGRMLECHPEMGRTWSAIGADERANVCAAMASIIQREHEYADHYPAPPMRFGVWSDRQGWWLCNCIGKLMSRDASRCITCDARQPLDPQRTD